MDGVGDGERWASLSSQSVIPTNRGRGYCAQKKVYIVKTLLGGRLAQQVESGNVMPLAKLQKRVERKRDSNL